MGCLLYFLKNKHLNHPKYVQKASEDNISAVYRPDRKVLLDYLYGKETQNLKNIDEIVCLEMPTQIKQTKSNESKNCNAKVSGPIKGQLISKELFGVFLRISALASKRGWIKKIKTLYI